MRQKRVEWHFNQFFAPTNGGAWESLVKVVKQFLYSIAGEQSLDDESPANVS